MRVAGNLNQRAYGDPGPRNLTQMYVAGDVEVVADGRRARE